MFGEISGADCGKESQSESTTCFPWPANHFETDPARVKSFLQENGITHPVVRDNDYAIWKRWNNRYWPVISLLNQSTGILARGGMPKRRG